jgi:hypothetical protein
MTGKIKMTAKESFQLRVIIMTIAPIMVVTEFKSADRDVVTPSRCATSFPLSRLDSKGGVMRGGGSKESDKS